MISRNLRSLLKSYRNVVPIEMELNSVHVMSMICNRFSCSGAMKKLADIVASAEELLTCLAPFSVVLKNPRVLGA